MSGDDHQIWQGYTGELVLVLFRLYHAKHFIKPGDQETH